MCDLFFPYSVCSVLCVMVIQKCTEEVLLIITLSLKHTISWKDVLDESKKYVKMYFE